MRRRKSETSKLVRCAKCKSTPCADPISAEDFGAVLAELIGPTPIADALEKEFPQKNSRWWFSIRAHVTSYFEAREYKSWKDAGEPKRAVVLEAKAAWDGMKRPEMFIWVYEALGLDTAKIKEAVEQIREERSHSKRVEKAKGCFDWHADVEPVAKRLHRDMCAASAGGLKHNSLRTVWGHSAS